LFARTQRKSNIKQIFARRFQMTAANDCELVRVFTRRAAAGSTIADETIKSNEAFRVVLQAEAGETLHNNGGPYRLILVVKDETAGTSVNTATHVPAQGAAKQDHIYRAIAVVRAGNVDPIVAFAESELFIITPP
jgi:hypothetical protein